MTHAPVTTALYFSALAADPELLEIVVEFVDALPRRVADLDRALERHDWTSLAALSHQFKGAAGSYGFDGLSFEVGMLEQAIRQADGVEARSRLAEIHRIVTLTRAAPPPAAG